MSEPPEAAGVPLGVEAEREADWAACATVVCDAVSVAFTTVLAEGAVVSMERESTEVIWGSVRVFERDAGGEAIRFGSDMVVAVAVS